MRQIAGRPVFTELAEMVAPQHTAVVVVDMQHDYLSVGGSIYAQNGNNDMVRNRDQLIAKVAQLNEQARVSGVLVLYLQQTQLEGLRNESAPWMNVLYGRHGLSPDIDRCREGTWGWEIVPELTPQDGDVVVRKWRSSGFAGTNMDIILRANNIRTVVICGVATDGCVKATALHAFFSDYFVVMVTDAMGAGSDAGQQSTLAYMDKWCNGQHHTDEVTGVWRRSPAVAVQRA